MLYVADETGAQRLARAAWLHDGERWIGANCAWVAGADGVLRQSEGCIGAIDLDIISTTTFTITFGWSAPGSSVRRLYINGALWNGDGGSFETSGTMTLEALNPSTTYTLQMEVLYGTDIALSPVLTARTGDLQAPTNLRSADIGNSGYRLVWNPVVGATDYSVRNAATGAEYMKSGGLTVITRTGLASGTTYSDVVRALHTSGAQSVDSNVSTQKTLSNFPAGTYTFYATSADTWSHGAQAWRGTGQGKLWHGDGGAFGASGGSRYAFFFGYREASTNLGFQQFFASKGALNYTVLKTEVYMMRSSTQHGIYSSQACKWSIHGHASKPSRPNAEWGHMAGSLKLGEGKWIEISRDYGRDLARGAYHGIAWGGTPYYSNGAGFMYGPTSLTGGAPMGAVRITVA